MPVRDLEWGRLRRGHVRYLADLLGFLEVVPSVSEQRSEKSRGSLRVWG